MTRYLIAIVLPSSLELAVRRYYQQTFNEPCYIHTLHCTFISPFILNESITPDILLKKITVPPDTFQFGVPNVFVQKSKNVLYLPIIPPEPLAVLYKEIFTMTAPSVHIETNAYNGGVLPEYLPHVTVNYNFKGEISQFLAPQITFNLPTPQLLIETGPGIWVPVA